MTDLPSPSDTIAALDERIGRRLARDQLAAAQETSRFVNNSNAALRATVEGLLSKLESADEGPQERIASALERIATVMEREAVSKELERREVAPSPPFHFPMQAFSGNPSD